MEQVPLKRRVPPAARTVGLLLAHYPYRSLTSRLRMIVFKSIQECCVTWIRKIPGTYLLLLAQQLSLSG